MHDRYDRKSLETEASGLRTTTHVPRLLVIAVVLCYIVYLLQC